MTSAFKPEVLLSAALRGEIAPWPADADSTFESDLLDSAADHGVAELLSVSPALQGWSGSIKSALLQRRREAAAAEIIREQELAKLLDALNESGVGALLLKGAGLAYTVYPQSWLRPRLDTDLLVAPGDRTRAIATLESLGYDPSTHFGGELVSYQAQFRKSDRLGLLHRVDLHWKIANPQVFADAFGFEELQRQSVRIPRLGSSARTLSPDHSLVLACVHRVAHHANSDRLLWLYDIVVLLNAMSAPELERARAIAEAKDLQSIVAAGVGRALDVIGPRAQKPEIDRLLRTTDPRDPATIEFLRARRTKFDDLRSDIRALSGWAAKLRLIREHLFPPAAYIRQAYGVSHPVLLPFAYAVRAVSGATKWFRPEQ
jgi:putative nucleotidyltransferase-like protein